MFNPPLLWRKISRSTLITGSAVLTIGTFTANIGNYFFNLFMGRFLGPDGYGAMAAVIALLYIVSVPSVSLNYVITKFTSRFAARGEKEKLRLFFTKVSKLFLGTSLLIFALLFVLATPLSSFLNIDSSVPVIILGALLGASLLVSVNNSTLQGLLNFKFLAFNAVLTVGVKLLLGVGLVWLGFSVNGALLGFLAGFLAPYLVAFWPLRSLFGAAGDGIDVDWGEILKYSAPVFLSTLGLTLIYTGDVVLVKHFFPADQAGLYSSLSLVARVILFVTTPVAQVMFPLISKKHAKGESYTPLFGGALGLVLLAVAAITTFYYIVPEFTVKLFFGEEFLPAAPFLGRFALFLSLYSLCNIFVSFFLSIQKTRIAALPLLFGGLEMGLIWHWHDSFAEVLNVATSVSLALLVAFVLYYLFGTYGRGRKLALDKRSLQAAERGLDKVQKT